MSEKVYLDTSAIVKRYIVEDGTEIVDRLYRDAHAGQRTILFSIFNVVESAVVFDKYERRGVIKSAKKAFERFLGETRLLLKLGQLIIVPINLETVLEAIELVFKHGIYIVDAIQISSAKNARAFLTFDSELAKIAKKEGFELIC